ncbi:hypothetical protein JCM5353_000061 [Sporobolomyces roseus]
MSHSTNSQTEYIVLVTSDEPSLRHTIPRSVLSSFSKTFQDLLSLPINPTTPMSDEIPIAETEHQLKGFLRMLKSVEKGEEADLSDLGAVDWENLARLSDKYDSVTARVTIKSHVWECIATETQLEHAFYLAIALEDTVLVQHTCTEALVEGWLRSDKVNAWRYRRTQVFESLVWYDSEKWYCARKNACRLPDVHSAWQRACYVLLRSYHPQQTVRGRLTHELGTQASPLCAAFIARLAETGTAIDTMLPKLLDLTKG